MRADGQKPAQHLDLPHGLIYALPIADRLAEHAIVLVALATYLLKITHKIKLLMDNDSTMERATSKNSCILVSYWMNRAG